MNLQKYDLRWMSGWSDEKAILWIVDNNQNFIAVK